MTTQPFTQQQLTPMPITTRNVGQCPTWRPPCRILVAPSVQRRKVWLTLTTRVPCSNVAKTRNPLKSAGVPQARQQISAVSRLKFTILSGHVEERKGKERKEVYLYSAFIVATTLKALRRGSHSFTCKRRYWCLTSFFLIVDTCLSSEDIAQQSCAMVPKCRFFASCISSEPRAAHFRHAF